MNAVQKHLNKIKTTALSKTTYNLHKPNADRSALRYSQRKINKTERKQFIEDVSKKIKN